MGGWVKDIIRKGDFLGELDEMSTDRRRGEAFLAALKGEDGRTYQDYVDILEQHRVVKTASHARHLRQHWFPQNWQDPNNTDVWWREYQPIEPIIHRGYLQAFEKAKEFHWRVPIDAYWMAIGIKVLISVAWNPERHPRQITLIRITPPVPKEQATPAETPGYFIEEPIEIIRRWEEDDAEVKDENGNVIAVPDENGIVVVRARLRAAYNNNA